MQYVRVPKALAVADIKAEEFCFSPGRYVRFIPPATSGRTEFISLDQLVTIRDQKVKARKADVYHYAEIGDIDVDTGGVAFRKMRGFMLPTLSPQRVAQDDVLISTVRTYRKGIGLVTDVDSVEPLVTSNAILALKGITGRAPHASLHYVYSFLRTDFFVEQVWSLLNRGLYPRMDTGALRRILLPVPASERVAAYVGSLALAIAEKEREIRARDAQILSGIETELATAQKPNSFSYSYPSSKELQSLGRFDAAIYSRDLKAKRWMVTNYAHGYQTPTRAGFVIKPGPSLEIKLLRTRIDSDVPKKGFYALYIPANISDFGTMSRVTYLGTSKSLALLQRGDILIGEAGFKKGRSIVLIDPPQRATTNAHGLYARRQDGNLDESIVFRCVFHWYRSVGLIDLMAVGGSGGHFSPQYFDALLVPSFPDDVKARLVSLYNAQSASSLSLRVEGLVDAERKRNPQLGIFQLDADMKTLQAELSRLQLAILEGEDAEALLPK